MTLSPVQLDTLRNLAAKKAGGDVGWVAIAEARELTELGLAARTRSGWEITPEGESALKLEGEEAAPEPPPETLPFPPRDHGET